MITKTQQQELDSLTALAYQVADGKAKYETYQEAEKTYAKKYGGN